MTEPREDVLHAIESLHRDIPRRTQVSLTMSMDTRDDVGAVRDELNDVVGNRAVTTDDVMRLALVAAARYHTLATGGDVDLKPIDRDELVPLTGILSRVINEKGGFDRSDESAE